MVRGGVSSVLEKLDFACAWGRTQPKQECLAEQYRIPRLLELV